MEMEQNQSPQTLTNQTLINVEKFHFHWILHNKQVSLTMERESMFTEEQITRVK